MKSYLKLKLRLLVLIASIGSLLACESNSDCEKGSQCQQSENPLTHEVTGVCFGGYLPGNSNDSSFNSIEDEDDRDAAINNGLGAPCETRMDCGPRLDCEKDIGQSEGVCS